MPLGSFGLALDTCRVLKTLRFISFHTDYSITSAVKGHLNLCDLTYLPVTCWLAADFQVNHSVSGVVPPRHCCSSHTRLRLLLYLDELRATLLLPLARLQRILPPAPVRLTGKCDKLRSIFGLSGSLSLSSPALPSSPSRSQRRQALHSTP